jgi:hypothetical protein
MGVDFGWGCVVGANFGVIFVDFFGWFLTVKLNPVN